MISIKKYVKYHKSLIVLMSFLAIFFMGTIKAMRMNPEAIRIAKIKKALIEKKRKAEEAEKASKLREEQKVIKTEIAEKARGLRPNEYFIYAAGTDDGVKISLEALQQSDLLTSMIDVTGMYGGKEIPLAGYLFEQIKIVCDTLNSWLENKKRVEESIKGLSEMI